MLVSVVGFYLFNLFFFFFLTWDPGILRSLSKCHGQACPWSIGGRGHLRDELHRVPWEPRRRGLLCAHPVTGEPGEQREDNNDAEPWQRPAARWSNRPQQEVRNSSHVSIKTRWPEPLAVDLKGASLCALRDNLVLTKSGPAEFRFRLSGVQLSDRGYYWCDITAFTKQQPGQTWTKATSAESNKIRIDFQENGGCDQTLRLFPVSVTSLSAFMLTSDQEGLGLHLGETHVLTGFWLLFLLLDQFWDVLSL